MDKYSKYRKVKYFKLTNVYIIESLKEITEGKHNT